MQKSVSNLFRLRVFMVALSLAMFLFGISVLLSSSHNTTGIEVTPQQTDISGDENDELPVSETDTEASDL